MILYPLDTLRALGINDIMIISGGNHLGGIAEFLGDGSDYDVELTYRVQKDAGGIAQALALAEDFAHGQGVWVILGDNIFGNKSLKFAVNPQLPSWHAKIFLSEVEFPERFGVYTDGKIEEKPHNPKSKKAVTGLYYFPPNVFDEIHKLHPSKRGELEVTDLNNYYLGKNQMEVFDMPGFWSDAGMVDSLKDAIDWAYGQGRT